jgi:hypothetical protein
LVKLETRDIYRSKSKEIWQDAKNICNSQNLELAELYSKEDFNKLLEKAKRYLDQEDSDGFWMGSSVIDQQYEGGVGGKHDYFWVCGVEPIPTFLWIEGEPNRLKDKSTGAFESCVHFYKSKGTSAYGFNDWVCYGKMWFLCQTEEK